MENTEVWKEIDGFPGYLISNFGNIYSNKVNRLLRPRLNHKAYGYYQINLSKNNEKHLLLIHRLVYENFIGKIPEGLQINHIDEDKTNNRLENLEIVTQSQNLRHGTCQKRKHLTRITNNSDSWSYEWKPCINETTGIKYNSAKEAARLTGGSYSGIKNACLKTRKTYKKEIWSYI